MCGKSFSAITVRRSRAWGDLHAMIGSLSIAEDRLLKLLERYDADLLERASHQLLDYSERWMRAEIRELPDGIFYAADCMEDDGATDQPVWMRLKLIVVGDEIIADWTGSDPQAKGPINATFSVTAAATYSAILHVTNKDIPRNSGCFRPDTNSNQARDACEREASWAISGRKHRDPSAYSERCRGRIEPSDPRPNSSRRRGNRLQLSFWRLASRYG